MAGEVGILNVAAGDTKISFDPSNSEEVERAKRVLTDMIRRGFAILIEIGRDDKGPMYRRALDFDPTTTEYIIAGTPGDIEEEPANAQSSSPPPRRTRSRQGATTRVPAASTNAVAVARTSGG